MSPSFRYFSFIFILVLTITGCSGSGDDKPITEFGALLGDGESGAVILYQGVVYRMQIVGECGPAADGSFSTWAATLDSNGTPLPKQPHMHALSEGNWSVVDFYPGLNDQIVRVARTGADKLRFDGRRLEFDSSRNSTDQMAMVVACPG
jgi:hypothetical protein